MLDKIFKGIFDSDTMQVVSVSDFMLCVGVALLAGLIIALGYMRKTKYTKSFVVTLAILPAVVCVVIMMVNGNVGAGVAVAGAFSLVRFRSVPGTAKEIGTIFLAMGAGLIAGMGYLGFSMLFTVIMSLVVMVYNSFGFGAERNMSKYKTIKITIPEDLDYTGVFDDIFSEYVTKQELVQVKTTNMGSMFKLTYDVVLKDLSKEKEMIDDIRCRNGNLEVLVSRQETVSMEL
ncbi:MAG: DUF4956 domain-containing protein [Lachnospiraceae bacterium]|nr:DUF4956 domain-containing protein [Lachnospiraceae bacterium]